MSLWQTDAVVIGAGVVGLAIARELAERGLETVVLERHGAIGTETSSRNSEVIHAGIYYPPGSLKARTCVRGKALLYDYLRARGVPYARVGKLIVAAGCEDEQALDVIQARARDAGVADLEPLSARALAAREPAVRGRLALFSPSTGIVDSHQLMLSLQGDLERTGGVVAVGTELAKAALSHSGEHRLETSDGTQLAARIVVNCAGLSAATVWTRLGLGDGCPAQRYAIGHYYSYTGPVRLRHLVYPTPVHGGLGIHATLDLAGQLRFGPDVRWIESVGYGFDDRARSEFATAIQRYLPEVNPGQLAPAYTGIRPKIVGPDEPSADFLCLTEREHGMPGVVSLHGIESPGLTASLALAEDVATALC